MCLDSDAAVPAPPPLPAPHPPTLPPLPPPTKLALSVESCRPTTVLPLLRLEVPLSDGVEAPLATESIPKRPFRESGPGSSPKSVLVLV